MAKRCFYRAINPDLETVAYFAKFSKAVEWIERMHAVSGVYKDGAPNRARVVTTEGDYRVLPVALEM